MTSGTPAVSVEATWTVTRPAPAVQGSTPRSTRATPAFRGAGSVGRAMVIDDGRTDVPDNDVACRSVSTTVRGEVLAGEDLGREGDRVAKVEAARADREAVDSGPSGDCRGGRRCRP
jgi:hypothetical protein